MPDDLDGCPTRVVGRTPAMFHNTLVVGSVSESQENQAKQSKRPAIWIGVRPRELVGHQPCSITLWWLVRVRPAPPRIRAQLEIPLCEMPQGSWSDSNHVPQHSGVDASQAQSSLFGVDAIVNCAGTLQDAPGDSTAGVHHKGVASLIAACEKMGVRRFIHLSAIGVDRARVWSFTGTVRLFRRWMRR